MKLDEPAPYQKDWLAKQPANTLRMVCLRASDITGIAIRKTEPLRGLARYAALKIGDLATRRASCLREAKTPVSNFHFGPRAKAGSLTRAVPSIAEGY